MNGRIKELAVEAGIISAEYNGFDPTGLTKAQRKFAELIVRDCACVPTDMWGRGELPADQASRVQRRILAHFDVA